MISIITDLSSIGKATEYRTNSLQSFYIVPFIIECDFDYLFENFYRPRISLVPFLKLSIREKNKNQ